MSDLTRSRYHQRADCWHVYYNDVHVGTGARRVGNPHDINPSQWNCGFYPGSHPGEHQTGTAGTFDQARADFGQAWQISLSKWTEADSQEGQDDKAWTAEKYRRFDRRERECRRS